MIFTGRVRSDLSLSLFATSSPLFSDRAALQESEVILRKVKAGTDVLILSRRTFRLPLRPPCQSQTAKLKRLMPYWRKTRRNGGW